MKKICVIFFLFVVSLPACAMKVINPFEWDTPLKVEVMDVTHALQARVKFIDSEHNYSGARITGYTSNLDCHELTRMRKHKGTKQTVSKKSERIGVSYLRPTRYSLKLNDKATDYVKYLFNRYPDKITFSIHGYGIMNNFVGEFYINGTSLNKHLIQKGYCSYVD